MLEPDVSATLGVDRDTEITRPAREGASSRPPHCETRLIATDWDTVVEQWESDDVRSVTAKAAGAGHEHERA